MNELGFGVSPLSSSHSNSDQIPIVGHWRSQYELVILLLSKLLRVRILSRISSWIFEFEFPGGQGIELEKMPKYFVSFLRATKLFAVLYDIILHVSLVHTLCFV